MKHLISILLLICLVVNAEAQTTFNLTTTPADVKLKLDRALREYRIATVDTKTIATHCEKSQPEFQLDFFGKILTFSLEEVNILSPNFVLYENGRQMPSTELEFRTFKGIVNGNPTNPVRLTVGSEYLDGSFTIDGESYFINPIGQVVKAKSSTEHQFVVYRSEDVILDGNVKGCGIKDKMASIQRNSQMVQQMQMATLPAGCSVIEIATEADFEYFQANGSSIALTNAEIVSILNQVEGIYINDFPDIRFLITAQNVWSTAADPYDELVDGDIIWEDFRDHWNNNFQNTPRDIGYLFSGKPDINVRGTVGVIGQMCVDLSQTYGLTSAELTVVTVNAVTTTAHEIAHTLSALHIGGGDCATPTLMCTIGAATIDNRLQEFHAININQMNAHLNNHSACLNTLESLEDAEIVGTGLVCINETKIYSIDVNPAFTTNITWSISSPAYLTIQSGQGTDEITVKGASSGRGPVTITATLDDIACTPFAELEVWFGDPNGLGYHIEGKNTWYGPSFDVDHYDLLNMQAYDSYDFWIVPDNPGIEIFKGYWSANPNTIPNLTTTKLNYASIDDGKYRVTTTSSSGYAQLNVQAQNTCGTSPSGAYFFTIMMGGYGYSMTMSPNPASDELTLSIVEYEVVTSESEEKALAKSEDPVVTVAIFNQEQTKLISQSTNVSTGQLKVNTSSLSPGRYVVHTTLNGKTMVRHLIVE